MRYRWGPGCGRVDSCTKEITEGKGNGKVGHGVMSETAISIFWTGESRKSSVSKRTFLTCSDKWKWGYSARDEKKSNPTP